MCIERPNLNCCRQLTILVLIILSSACASTPRISLPAGASISIAPVELRRIDTRVVSKTESTTKSVAFGIIGAVGGTAVGVVAGFGVGIMSCGPAFFICSPLAALGMGVMGAGGGAVLGVELGGEGIQSAKAKQFNEFSAQLIQQDQVQTQFRDKFRDKADQIWVLDGHSSNTLAVKIGSIWFKVLDKEHVQLQIHSSMKIVSGKNADIFKYKYAGDSQHIDYWLASNGRNIMHEMNTAIETITKKLVTLGSSKTVI